MDLIQLKIKKDDYSVKYIKIIRGFDNSLSMSYIKQKIEENDFVIGFDLEYYDVLEDINRIDRKRNFRDMIEALYKAGAQISIYQNGELSSIEFLDNWLETLDTGGIPMKNTEPTKSEVYISQEEQSLYQQIQNELFDEVRPGVFVKKGVQPVTDPNEACYTAIATYVYGFAEYSAKIDAVTNINYVRKNFHKSMLQESISTNFKIDIAIDLIRRGIDVNIQDFRGNTALHYLADDINESKAVKLFQIILENGADVNLLNNRGQSILWDAVHHIGAPSIGAYLSKEQQVIVKKLVDMGADKTILPVRFQGWIEEILNENSLS